MAGQADGSIIIDTELDSQGFDAGSKRLEAAVRSLVSKVNSLGPAFQRAMGGSEGAVASFQARASALRDQIAEMQQRLEQLGNTRSQTPEYEQLNAEIEKTDATISRLIDKQERMQALGVDQQSAQWRGLQYDLEQAIAKYNDLLAAKQEMEASGGAYQMGSETAGYQQLVTDLDAAQGRLAEMLSEVQGVGEGASAAAGFFRTMAHAAGSVASALASAARSAMSGLLGAVRNAASHMGQLLSHSRGMKSQFSGLINSAKKFTLSLLGARGVYALLRRAVSAYMAENQALANTLSATWSGIGNLLGPIISRLISLVSTAVAWITSFLRLFGVVGKGATKAIGAAGGAAGKQVKELKRQLASFDELNILHDDSSDSGGGGGGGGGGLSTGQLADIEMPDWVKLMVDQLKAGNWGEAATTLATELNRMVSSVDWAGLGSKIGYYLNGALTFIATFIKQFDWFNLGANLATGVNEILRSVDWGNLGTILSAKFRIIIQTAAGFLLNLDWSALAQGFSDFAIGFFNGISDALAGINWKQLGADLIVFVSSINWGGITDAIIKALGSLSGALLSFLFGAISEAWGSVVEWWQEVAYEDGQFTMEGLLNGIWEGIKNIGVWIWEHIAKPFVDGFRSAFGIASPSKVMSEIGSYLIQGLLQGITNTWQSITQFFSTALSTVKTTISDAWSKIKTATSNTWGNIKSSLSNTWNNVKSTATNTWTGLKSAIGNSWSNVKSSTSTAWTSIKSSLSNNWTSIKNAASNTWNGIKSSLTNTWSSIKSSASTTWDSIKNNASSTWTNMKTTATNTWSSIKSAISEKASAIKSDLSSKFDSIKSSLSNKDWSSIGSAITSGISSGINSGWKWLKNTVSNLASNLLSSAKSALGIHSPSSLFRDEVGLMIGAGVGEGVTKSKSGILKAVSGVADAIADEFQSGSYVLPAARIDGAMQNFTDRIIDRTDALLDHLQAIAERVTFVVPNVALGTVVPYGAAASMQENGDMRTLIEEVNDDLASVIAQSVSAATVAVVDAIRNAGDRPIQIDKRALSDAVCADINRRARMFNSNPLLT